MMNGLLIGASSGLVASALTAPVDKVLKRFISEDQKAKEQSVREASPHHIGGIKFGERLLRRDLSPKEQNIAQLVFTAAYGLGWGSIYWTIRRMVPRSSKYAGIPFAIGFYLACDGLIAPLAKLSPSVHRVPWQFNLKEFTNHAIWTATAEAIDRWADRRSGDRREPLP